MLSSLSPADRDRVLQAGRRRHFARGETLFHYGDRADAVHLLDRGRVAVRVLTPQGDQVILNVLGPGQVFGELALIDPPGPGGLRPSPPSRPARPSPCTAASSRRYGPRTRRWTGSWSPRSRRR